MPNEYLMLLKSSTFPFNSKKYPGSTNHWNPVSFNFCHFGFTVELIIIDVNGVDIKPHLLMLVLTLWLLSWSQPMHLHYNHLHIYVYSCPNELTINVSQNQSISYFWHNLTCLCRFQSYIFLILHPLIVSQGQMPQVPSARRRFNGTV